MNESVAILCWNCGASLADEPQPFAREARCEQCNADLHVCHACEFFDRRVANACREPIAEPVQNKERANFCGYFLASAGAYRGADEQVVAAARSDLDALFGLGEHAPQAANTEEPDRALRDLFGIDDKEP